MHQNDSNSWHRGHILGEKYDGAMSIHNVRPLCTGCNYASRPFLTTYGYMSHIGTLTKQEADRMENTHLEMLRNCIGQHAKRVYHCIARTQKGTRCTFNKVGLSVCCNVHMPKEEDWINLYMQQNHIIESIQRDEENLRLLMQDEF